MPTRPSKVSVLDDIGDPDASPGSQPWSKWMLGQAKLRRHDLQRDVTGLQAIIKKLEKHSAWAALGFASFSLLCHMELDLDDSDVESIRSARPGQALGSVITRAKEAKPLLEQGRPEKGNNVTFNGTRGNHADYLAARIARDRPDILERMKAGKYRSVRAAAIEAGIVKVPSDMECAKKGYLKLDARQREQFRVWVNQQ